MQRHLSVTEETRIGIFKTNIGTMKARKHIISAICNTFEVTSCNVDIEDCDRVLRVVDMKVGEESMIRFVRDQGFECDVLECTLPIMQQPEIQQLLDKSFTDFSDFVGSLSDHRFIVSPEGKWSAGQQLDHLIRSAKPVNKALGMPGSSSAGSENPPKRPAASKKYAMHTAGCSSTAPCLPARTSLP